MFVCKNCGNTKHFISERYYLHWVDLDGQGEVTSVSPTFQGENTSGLMPWPEAHTECGMCNSADVEEEEEPPPC